MPSSAARHSSSIVRADLPDLDSIDLSQLRTIKRDGDLVEFKPEKIESALLKAFVSVEGKEVGNSISTRNKVRELRSKVIQTLVQRRASGGNMAVHIEEIQDVVELVLMISGEHKIARAYILYREDRSRARAPETKQALVHVIEDDGSKVELPRKRLSEIAANACAGLQDVDPQIVLGVALQDLYDGVSIGEVRKALVMASRTQIENEPNYSYVSARLLLHSLRREILGREVMQKEMKKLYPECLGAAIAQGIAAELLDPELAKFDLGRLGEAIEASRDLKFDYLGLQTLYDRYFLQIDGRRTEMPQVFFMRVAMGLALREERREERAIEFYNVLSSFDFMSSTPTLFNSGTLHSQLSSCYLTTVADDLEGIFGAITENALLSKYAGGLGNDWTPVRALGSYIKGTNGKSQGVVPFLKVVNDTAVAVNQGGKRKGAVCVYLETWHLDIEEFLELRKNTGDDRRRTHDMNTANWIPDLFMKRVMEDGEWTLFSPNHVPELHELTGKAFEAAYVAAEAKARNGQIKLSKRVSAVTLWRKMLGALFETGHPWVTFKDPSNLRSPQQHVGVVHNSNLCTEITLNTNDSEIAVCNLGSLNLATHLKDGELDLEKLQATIGVAMRMLDNVIDINFYPVEKARRSNMRHRPVGLGIMGFQDCLFRMRVPYASTEAVEFADRSMEAVCYYAYRASVALARERGPYETFKGSLWDRGLLPPDTLDILATERGGHVEVDRSSRLDWGALRKEIGAYGMRNSNCVAIAPTATISNIVGVGASIEPNYQNVFVKSNLSGEFTVINEYLVRDLKARDLWDRAMIADLKYFDGSVQRIQRIPPDLRSLYATAFEIDATWLIEAAARRQKWIDQAQSLNIYMAGASGKKLDETYKLAWKRGLKTTYYLRTLGATSAEKSTVDGGGQLNAVASSAVPEASPEAPKVCSLANPECEACQ
jgi:ribonucleoside-diphosphate reductase alpha chain